MQPPRVFEEIPRVGEQKSQTMIMACCPSYADTQEVSWSKDGGQDAQNGGRVLIVPRSLSHRVKGHGVSLPLPPLRSIKYVMMMLKPEVLLLVTSVILMPLSTEHN